MPGPIKCVHEPAFHDEVDEAKDGCGGAVDARAPRLRGLVFDKTQVTTPLQTCHSYCAYVLHLCG